MRYFPRTQLYLSVLRQELISIEGLSRVSPDGTTDGEVHRARMVSQSIEELEYLLGTNRRGWSFWQLFLLVGVSVLSLIFMVEGVWILLFG